MFSGSVHTRFWAKWALKLIFQDMAPFHLNGNKGGCIGRPCLLEKLTLDHVKQCPDCRGARPQVGWANHTVQRV